MKIFTASFDKVVVRQSVDIYTSQQQDVLVPIPEPSQSLLRWGGILMAIFGTSGFTFWAIEDAKKTQPAESKASQPIAPTQTRAVVAKTPRIVQDTPPAYSAPTYREPAPAQRQEVPATRSQSQEYSSSPVGFTNSRLPLPEEELLDRRK
ncbi:MAG TPA: hypothetical protein V6D16_08825, partial [Candidatus Obscuribacterales bacterium]